MKPTQKTPQTYKQLTGSPGLTAVSDAAKGKDPQTLAEFEESYNDMAIARKDGNESTTPPQAGAKSDCDDIEEAYAMLFEGLAMIARSHSKEEDSEEGTSGKPGGKCGCCQDDCSCGDCEGC